MLEYIDEKNINHLSKNSNEQYYLSYSYVTKYNKLDDNKGYSMNNSLFENIIYQNMYSYFLKKRDEYYFYKKKTIKTEDWQWFGYHTEVSSDTKIVFDICFWNHIPTINYLYGIKTHDPPNIYQEWIKKCIPNQYITVEINIKLNKGKQWIIFYFDQCYDEISLSIKNFYVL